MVLHTWHFAPRILAEGELSKAIRATIGEFSHSDEQAHLDINVLGDDGWDIIKDWADYEDLNSVCNLSVLSLRAWFQSHSKTELYFAIHGQESSTSVTVSAESILAATELLDALAAKLGLEKRRDPLDELMEQIERLKECPYDFTQIVQDAELADILAKRWVESERAFAGQSYLSTIVLLGSLLEGILFDKVQQNPKPANQASSSPKHKGAVLPFDQWTLENLIAVAHECGWIDKDVRDFSVVVRDYRNLVHPRHQRALGVFPDVGTCKVAREVVAAAIEDLQR